MCEFFNTIGALESFFWAYIGFLLVVLAGLYFTIKSGFYQFRVLMNLKKTIRDLIDDAKGEVTGHNPIKIYFASVSGMIGLGNIVAIVTAVLVGGPGSIFWLWIAAFCGMIIKYCEVYLGMKFRVPNKKGGYDGGSMVYLPHAFKSEWAKKLVFGLICTLICIYGVEVYQFVVITDTLSQTFKWNKDLVVFALLAMTLYVGIGGMKRLANVATILGPIFITLYVVMCVTVVVIYSHELPAIFMMIFKSAFVGQAPLGGFVGSTFMLAAQQGTARAVYSADIGIGYDSIIQSETRAKTPEKQARMMIFGAFADVLFCTLSLLVILATGVWLTPEKILTSQYVAKGLGMVFPYVDYYMAFFIFMAGWTTIMAYFTVGLKVSKLLSRRFGKLLYVAYASYAFYFFSFYDQTKVLVIMSLCGGLLISVNLFGIIRLRHHIKFR